MVLDLVRFVGYDSYEKSLAPIYPKWHGLGVSTGRRMFVRLLVLIIGDGRISVMFGSSGRFYFLEEFMDRFFKLTENKTNVRTEILAGVTTFFAMSYIVVVNPGILSEAGMG